MALPSPQTSTVRAPACLASDALDELPAPSHDGGSSDFDQEQLQNVLNDLPEEFRSPVVLFYFEEFSYKEIAEQMGVPVGTIMSRLARAKACLRQRLTEPGPHRFANDRPATTLSGALSGAISQAVPHARAP